MITFLLALLQIHTTRSAKQQCMASMKTIFPNIQFSQPESIQYDPAKDLYYVDEPFASKNLRLDPNTGVQLNSFANSSGGLGSEVVNGNLYVALGPTVTVWDTNTAQNIGSVPVSSFGVIAFLNGMCTRVDRTDPNNPIYKIYTTDVGQNFTSNGARNGANGVWEITVGTNLASTTAQKIALSGTDAPIAPNGCTVAWGGKLCFANFGPDRNNPAPLVVCQTSNNSFAHWTKHDVPGYYGGDGLYYVEAIDTLFVTSWYPLNDLNATGRGSVWAKMGEAGAWQEVLTGLTGPADIGYDSLRNLLLVPELNFNRIVSMDVMCVTAPGCSSCPNQITKSFPTYSNKTFADVLGTTAAALNKNLTYEVEVYYEDPTGARMYAQCGEYVYVNNEINFLNSPPLVSWKPKATPYKKYVAYTVLMFDPDIPGPTNVLYNPFLHWLVSDIPSEMLNASNPSGGNLKSQYYRPRPPAGQHRYTFAVFGQLQKNINWNPSPFLASPFGVGHLVDPTTFQAKYPLELIGLNYFLANMTTPTTTTQQPQTTMKSMTSMKPATSTTAVGGGGGSNASNCPDKKCFSEGGAVAIVVALSVAILAMVGGCVFMMCRMNSARGDPMNYNAL